MMIDITLAFVDENGQPYYQSLSVPVGTSIRGALQISGWLMLPALAWLNEWLANIDDNDTPVHKSWYLGVFSQKKSLGYVLQTGDRLEIYRPLSVDAMNNRQSKVVIAKKQTAKAIQAKNIARRDERKKAGD